MGIEALVETGIKAAFATAIAAASPAIDVPAYRSFWLDDETDKATEDKAPYAVGIVAAPSIPDGVGSMFQSVKVEITVASSSHDDPKRAALIALWAAIRAPLYANTVTVDGYGVSGLEIMDGESSVDDMANRITLTVTMHLCGA